MTAVGRRRQGFDETADAVGRDLRQYLHQSAVDPACAPIDSVMREVRIA